MLPSPPPLPARATGHSRVSALGGMHKPEDPWGASAPRGASATAAAAPSFRLGPTRLFTAPLRVWGPVAQARGSRGWLHFHLCLCLGASAHQGEGACVWKSWRGCRAAGETVNQPDAPRGLRKDEDEGVTTCIPVPSRSWHARVLQGGGGCLQPQQAKGFCEGGLYQLHLLFLHLKPLTQGLQGLVSRALAWERDKKHSECTTTWGNG